MKKDIKDYFSLLFFYLKGKWITIISGIILGIIAETCTLISPLLSRYLMDFVLIGKNYSYFKPLIFISIIVLIVYLLTSYFANYILINVFKTILVNLKLDIFKKLQYAPINFYEKETSGGITYRIHSDTESLADSWREFLIQIPMQLILLISAVFMIKWNHVLAIFAFIILIIQSYIIAKFRNPILQNVRKAKTKAQEINSYTVEHFKRIQLVKSLSTESLEQKNFLNKLKELIKIEIKTFIIIKISNILQSLISNIWSLGILFYGGVLTIQGKMTIGTLMGFLMFTGILYQPISSLTNLILSFQSIRVILSRIKEYLDIKPNIIDKIDAIDFVPKEGKIVLENVSFYYNSKKVLHNINVEFPPNTITAIVGPTGAGKTTLAKLMVRFFDPQEGRILLDGVDIRDIKLQSLRKNVLLILHDCFVFNGTLYENLLYGTHNINNKQLENALINAHIDFIQRLPNGIYTIIGEGGINLSTGEAQRVALARAFLISPKVFIFDEPTSNIDLETEKKISKTLIKLKEKSNIIIIAHRPSTYKIADRIIVLENGKIKKICTYDQLSKFI